MARFKVSDLIAKADSVRGWKQPPALRATALQIIADVLRTTTWPSESLKDEAQGVATDIEVEVAELGGPSSSDRARLARTLGLDRA